MTADGAETAPSAKIGEPLAGKRQTRHMPYALFEAYGIM